MAQQPHDGKVFGIGLNKTGTTSLTHALAMLGYEAFHFHHGRLTSRKINERVEAAVRDGRPPLDRLRALDRFDAYFDIEALVRHFPAFDRAYPGSKFILHTRPQGPWLDSREKHVRRNQKNPRYEGDWTTIDRDAWVAERDEHHERVRHYFAARPGDLLEIDLTAGGGWDELCPFLGCEPPTEPFPRENTASSPNQKSRFRRLLVR